MFMDLIREHRRGLTHDELTTELRDLVAAVAELRKTGSLTVTLKLTPRPQGEGVDVSCAINSKPPKEEPASSIFYISPNNELVREDPRQSAMELREVPGAGAARSLA